MGLDCSDSLPGARAHSALRGLSLIHISSRRTSCAGGWGRCRSRSLRTGCGGEDVYKRQIVASDTHRYHFRSIILPARFPKSRATQSNPKAKTSTNLPSWIKDNITCLLYTSRVESAVILLFIIPFIFYSQSTCRRSSFHALAVRPFKVLSK